MFINVLNSLNYIFMFSEECVVLVCTKLASMMCVAMCFRSCSEFVLAHCCVLARVVDKSLRYLCLWCFCFLTTS